MTDDALASPQGIHHVRLTVTNIERSKAFYGQLFGAEPVIDMSEYSGDVDALQDPARFYAGCTYSLGDQLFGLRPVAPDGDTFSSTRVGLDHVSLRVASLEELKATADRLTAAGIDHGQVTELGDAGIAILSLQDPDNINLEFTAVL